MGTADDPVNDANHFLTFPIESPSCVPGASRT